MVAIDKIKDIIEYTVKEYYGLTGKCSIIKSSPYYQNALRLSEKYGLKLKRCTRTELRFEDLNHVNPLNDRITSTELRFDAMLGEEDINFFDDASNQSEGVYSLDDVLGFYTSMPSKLKNGTGLMVFDKTSQPSYSIIYDPSLRRENVVHITGNAYSDNVTFNLERVMAHEMGHCLEMSQLTPSEKSVVRRLVSGSDFSDNDNEVFISSILPKINTYSRQDGVFGKAVDRDSDSIGLPKEYLIRSAYARSYYLRNHGDMESRLSEHFAETVSIVSFRDKVMSQNHATLDCGDVVPLNISYNEYVYEGGQVESIPVVEDLLFGDREVHGIDFVDYTVEI